GRAACSFFGIGVLRGCCELETGLLAARSCGLNHIAGDIEGARLDYRSRLVQRSRVCVRLYLRDVPTIISFGFVLVRCGWRNPYRYTGTGRTTSALRYVVTRLCNRGRIRIRFGKVLDHVGRVLERDAVIRVFRLRNSGSSARIDTYYLRQIKDVTVRVIG